MTEQEALTEKEKGKSHVHYFMTHIRDDDKATIIMIKGEILSGFFDLFDFLSLSLSHETKRHASFYLGLISALGFFFDFHWNWEF